MRTRITRTEEEKTRILEDYTRGELTREQVMEKYGIQTKGALYSLICNARKEEQNPTKIKRKKKKKQLSEADLRKIGDAAIENEFPVIRTTLVAGLGYGSFANNNRVEEIVSQLHNLDPKYSGLRFEPIDIPMTERKPWDNPQEREIVESILLKYIDEGYNGKNVPKGAVGEIKNRLREHGFDRSLPSIRKHAQIEWSNPKGYSNGHLPSRTLNQRTKSIITKRLEQHLLESDSNLEEEIRRTPYVEEVLVGVLTPDPGAKRRMKDLAFAGILHQRLMAYLINPDNYKRIFGPEFKLINADFSLENTPEELYAKYGDLVEKLQMTDVDEKVVRFIDNKARLDLFFKQEESGVYTVAEVKQYATNKINGNGEEGDANADRAGQQLFRYKGMVLYNILKLNRALPRVQRIPEKVLGYIAAYEIDEELQSIIQSQGDRIAIIKKNNVEAYLGKSVGDVENE